MSTLIQDLRYALRMLVRAPGFSVVIILTLGLGIGANTAIFSLMDQVLLRSLPVHDPSALVQLDGPGLFSGRTLQDRTFSYPMYRDLRDGNTVFSGLVAEFGTPATLGHRDQRERVDAELISGNTFDVLKVAPALGRALTPDDDRVPGGHPVAVLGYGYWQRRFAGDPSVIGQAITINSTPMTIAGVAPPGFAGVMSTTAADVFVPLMMKAQLAPTEDDLMSRRSRFVKVVGRLKPGLTATAAKAELDVLYRQINEAELQDTFTDATDSFRTRFREKTLVLHSAARGLSNAREDFSTPLIMLMAMVGVVLLIACANVATLLLTRATTRQKEMAVRLALGAPRGRLIRQTLTEGFVLAGAGGLVGVLLSIWLGDLLLSMLPSDSLSQSISTTPDLRVGIFTLAIAIVTAVGFGLVPALQNAGVELNKTMREVGAATGGGTRQARLRKGLVVAQVALSMLLVAGGGLFARSLYNLQHLNRGFDSSGLVSFSVDPSLSGYDQARIRQFADRLLGDIRALPGVTSASLAEVAALTNNSSRRTIEVQGYTPAERENMNAWANKVAPDYFRTMRLPLVAGREFSDSDDAGAPLVAIVNEAFARRFFGAQSAIGRRFGWSAIDNPGAIEIVGVVKDAFYSSVRQGARGPEETPIFAYAPFAQGARLNAMTVYVRSTPEALTALPEQLRRAARQADASLPVFSMQAVDTTVEQSLFSERMLAMLSAAFGLVATLLAAIGLYGVMAYTVSRRTREIGIRIALGAERRTVLWLVLREVAFITVAGIALAIPAAIALGGVVRSQLFGVSAADPWTMALASLVLGVVALVAGWLPARRAARVQPLLALRAE
ncbi:MAG TPA: ABC transporter permease [Vicinamibacterales bacterium]|nr:ABC transporter permease [Vicinamibacterales bacterium]